MHGLVRKQTEMCKLIMSNGLCACGKKPEAKHVHRRGPKGYCIDCNVMLYTPPLDLDVPLGEYPELNIVRPADELEKIWEM